MRIFFIGTVRFSYYALERLINIGANIVGVATKESSPFNADFISLLPLCEYNKIPCKLVNDINHVNNQEFVRACNPDVIYCFGWSNLIGTDILNIPPLGVVGFHPSSLPENRGRHPIIWALALGLKRTASTFFFMNEGADTGDILSQKKVSISFTDTAHSLYEKIIRIALEQIVTITRQLSTNTYNRKPQNISQGNVWRKRGKLDGQIDFRMNSATIYNLVRALTRPYIGAHVVIAMEDVKIWEVSIDTCNSVNLEPGKILDMQDGKIKVKTADGAVWLIKHDFKELPKVGEYL